MKSLASSSTEGENNSEKIFSIRWRLMLVYGVLTFLVVAVLTLFALRFAREVVMERIEEHLRDKAEYTARNVEAAIQKDFAVLRTVARSPVVLDPSIPPIEKALILQSESANLGVKSLYIIDREGMAQFPDGRTVKVTLEEFYKEPLKGHNYVSEPYIDREGEFQISSAVPLYSREGEIVGAMLADYDGFALNSYIKDIVIGKTGNAYIVGGDGVTIADPDSAVVRNRENSTEVAKTDKTFEAIAAFEQRALAADKPIVGFFEWDRIPMIASAAHIGDTGWVLIVSTDEMEFLDRVNHIAILILILGLVVLAVALLLTYSVSGRIATPIIRLSESIKDISEGNLSGELVRLARTRDEIGLLDSSVRLMVGKLREIVSEIHSNASSLSTASENINNTSQLLSEGANASALATEDISSTMQQIVSNAGRNTATSTETEKLSRAVHAESLSVRDLAQEANMAHAQINDKISVINDIAARTNILALNAAVEAARAGEYGRGFAVVAAEVRKLAEQSKVAAAEIISLVYRSSSLSEKAGHHLAAILPDIERTARSVHDIMLASDEQNAGATQVNGAVTRLSEQAQQNVAISEELASTSEEMTQQSAQLSHLIDYFRL